MERAKKQGVKDSDKRPRGCQGSQDSAESFHLTGAEIGMMEGNHKKCVTINIIASWQKYGAHSFWSSVKGHIYNAL